MGTRGLVYNIFRVAFAVTGVVAMTYQYAKLNGLASFSPGNFFSFFTIQSNILAATMLVLTALIRREERSRPFDAVRGAATFYITITFVVFALLLSGLQEDLDTHIAFTNFVVHYLIPIVLLVDWFIDPPRYRLGLRIAFAWLAYPVGWFAYTLVRGQRDRLVPVPVRRCHPARVRGSPRAGTRLRARVRDRRCDLRDAHRSAVIAARARLFAYENLTTPLPLIAEYWATKAAFSLKLHCPLWVPVL